MAYDILIKSGAVIDGTGKIAEVIDVGISEDKITSLGHLEGAKASLVIDASGKYVTPGFIDITNHSDTHLTLFRYPGLESLVMQGITTIIGGNCGASLAPLASPHAIDAIKKWVDPSQMNIDWTSMEEFLSRLGSIRLGTNFGTFAGFGTLRRGVIGDEVRALSSEEKEKIKFLISKALGDGAFGLSMGLSYGHERVSDTDEIIELVRVMQESKCVLKLHLRSEGSEILAAVNEAIRIGREANISIHISHLKGIGKKTWPLVSRAVELIDTARASGLDIGFDVSPYHTTGSLLYLLLPAWSREGVLQNYFDAWIMKQNAKK